VRHETLKQIRRGLLAASVAVFAMVPLASRATPLGDLAATVQPGQFKVLTTNNFNLNGVPGGILVPPGGSGSILEYTDEAQRNPVTKKIYIIGCARSSDGSAQYACSTSDSPDSRWVEYDEASNSWRTLPAAPFSIAHHGYDHAALDPASGDYFFRVESSSTVWRYSGGNWSRLPDMPSAGPCCGALEYFPDLGGLVFADPLNGGGQFYLYRPGSSSWQTLPGGIHFGEYHNFTEYSPVHKMLLLGGGVNGDRVLLRMDASGKVTRGADAPVSLGTGTCGAVHTIDPVSGNLVVFHCNRNIYSYNPATNTWAQHGTHSLPTQYGDLLVAAVPVTEHGVIFLARAGLQGPSSDSAVYLYRHSTGSPPAQDSTPPSAPTGLKVQ